MRTLIPARLSLILWLGGGAISAAQQTPTNPGSDTASAAAETDSPCFSERNAENVVVIQENTTRGLLIHKVNPSYPEAARSALIEGTVVLCASISKAGKITNLRAVSGPPELIAASLKAVKKWRYKPYLLNGEPVEVETDIRVNYTLSR
jgi:TonB family protein